ncbi:CbtA family protein [Streptomyces sp. NPDC050759]|uniref:CbtA family protein n=1 Tax=Streptomyces sp. NPDC050759 TaxID=3365635 RepID=UPI0037B054E1
MGGARVVIRERCWFESPHRMPTLYPLGVFHGSVVRPAPVCLIAALPVGAAFGVLLAVVYAVLYRRGPDAASWRRSLMPAGAGSAGVWLPPILRYPVNPPTWAIRAPWTPAPTREPQPVREE